MKKSTVYDIIQWVIALAACAYLGYKLVTFDDYATLWDTLRAMGCSQWLAIALSVALMPVNMALEAWRWRTLMNHQSPITDHQSLSWREAHRQVYYSKLAGLVTPWRLGEYPARGLLMNQSPITDHQSPITNNNLWPRILSMGAVGSVTMTAAIVLAGGTALLALVWFQENMDAFVILYRSCNIFIVVAALLALALYFAPRLLKRWAEVSHRLVVVLLGQSLIRLACWCVQLALVLWALGAYQAPITNYQLPIYYLLVTITPNVPVAEVGVRGAWAIAVFGSVNAAFAGVLLWVINTLLPCLVWPFLRKNAK